MENRIEIDDLGTPIFGNTHVSMLFQFPIEKYTILGRESLFEIRRAESPEVFFWGFLTWRQLRDATQLARIFHSVTRWWFQICFMFTPTWGNDPI